MNCKPGDMAIVMRGLSGPNSEHVGKVVTVVRAGPVHPAYGPTWNVEIGRPALFYRTTRAGKVSGIAGFRAEGLCPDAWLRPIRPEEGDDETLEWAGSPVRTEVPA